MSELSNYEAQVKKMTDLCYEHDLTFRLVKDKYPITFTVRSIQSPDAQTTMLENVEGVGYRSPEASMTWVFEGSTLETRVQGGTFTISKTLRSKIENILSKMITFWQQYFFRDVMERGALRTGMMPAIEHDNPLDEPGEDAADEAGFEEFFQDEDAAVDDEE